ncbi:MAG: monofunctional biosynthetic peptidoglycan transglycosylase [Bacteroidales bacterium]|nr:monofunctional biosynthetic peptidoglycan transglycosylase [Bacteroidales bacterium]
MYIIRRIFRWITFTIIFFFVSTIAAVVILKWLPVYYTPLMFIRAAEQVADGRSIRMEHQWVNLNRVSENMPLAVISSEDSQFLKHKGFDFEEIYKARLTAIRGGKERGASTISQQTAKNVFLWPGHSWLRKGLEAYFTVLIEYIWGKERIMEVYLNSVEMGDGIYGVKAVAEINFDKQPDQLTKRDAALIAATLPNPLKRDSKNPSGELLRRRNRIVQEMNYIKHVPFGVPVE